MKTMKPGDMFEAHKAKMEKKKKVSLSGVGKSIGNAVGKATGWPGGVNSINVNKSGTVGTEPISKGNSKYTELKAGKLGKLDIPMGTLNKKKSMKKTHKNKVMKKTFGSGVRLSGVTPNPAKITQNTSTPMMSAGKGYMPKSQLDAGGVPMKSKSKKVKNKSHKKSESAPVKSVYQKNWIAGAIKKPGALKAELGVKTGSKIPAEKLAATAKKGGKEGKRARLAETLKSFHKNKKMCKVHKKSMCKKCS